MKKVGFVSLGCPKNLVDSEVMMGMLGRHGYKITSSPEEADVLVVNTCSFIDSAKQESVDTILEMAEHKKTGKAKKLVVAGCLVERYGDEIREQIPDVDALVGTNELAGIIAACDGRLATTARRTASPDPREVVRNSAGVLPVLPANFFDPTATAPYLYDELTPRILATPRHSAYIKIAEGCDHPCSFCVIPQFRGAFRSRRFESVVQEAKSLAAKGVREITLVGQDTTCYGEDIGLKDGLALLLDRLAGIEELSWVRALYFYPNKITQRLLDTIAAHPRLCNYVDLPLQHASPAVLKSMKRGGGAEIFLKLMERIRRTIPGVSLRTSFIVGFPGETDADFELLCDFVREVKFDWMGCFAYSDEETSKSCQLQAKVPAEIIESRRGRLMAIQKKISRQARRRLVGQTLPVLVEGPSSESELIWEGRLESQAPEIDGKVLITEFDQDQAPAVGSFVLAEIIQAHDYDVFARTVTSSSNSVSELSTHDAEEHSVSYLS